jgi:hypothetical protein
MNPWIRFALAHAEQRPPHLEGVGRGRCAGRTAGLPASAGGSFCRQTGERCGVSIEPCRLGLKRDSQGWDELLSSSVKLVKSNSVGRDCKVSKPYTSHGTCLLSRYRDVRGASYHKAR